MAPSSSPDLSGTIDEMSVARSAAVTGRGGDAGAGAAVTCVAVHAGTRRTATGCSDGSLSIWEIESAQSVFATPLHGGRISAVSFSSDGQRLMTVGDDRTVRISDLQRATSTVVAASPGGVMRYLGIQRVGERHFAVARSYDHRVLRVLDLEGSDPPREIREPDRQVSNAVLLRDGTLVTLDDAGAIRTWSAAEPSARLELPTTLDAPLELAALPRGAGVVIGDARGRLEAWELSEGTPRFSVWAHLGAIRSVSFDEAGTLMVSGSHDGRLRVADALTGELMAEWTSAAPISCCAVTSHLSVGEAGYRVHARTRIAPVAVVGTSTGEVFFVELGGLVARWEDETREDEPG